MLAFIKKFKIILLILSIIFIGIFLSEYISLNVKIISYTISNTIRQILLFLIPFLIFPYMVRSIASMKTKGAYIVGSIMLMVAISNFISIMIPYFVGQIGIPLLEVRYVAKLASIEELKPLFDLGLEPLLKMEYTMTIALILGLYIGISRVEFFDNFFQKYHNFSRSFFERVFIPMLPIYVLGTILKIAHETDFRSLLPIFGGMIMLIIFTQLTYIVFLYYLGSGRDINRTIDSIKNAFQSCIVGFSTMSSVVTMPVTLKAAEKNIPEDPSSARVTVSTTVNCHDVGECISLPMIALTIYYITNGIFPDLSTYLFFAVMATIAQFGGVSVPGGSIVILLPILTENLGFTNEMCSMIIALSIFMDPIGTANNVLGNGAFAMIVYKVQSSLARLKNKVMIRTKQKIL